MSSNDQLDRLFWLSLRPFWWSRNASGDTFRRQKYFTETIEGMCTSGFKIRAKVEVNEHLSVHLTSQTSLPRSRIMRVGSAFQFGFLPSQHCFLLKHIFQFLLHRGKPTVSLVLSPCIGSQTGFSSRKSKSGWSGIQWFHPRSEFAPTSSPPKKSS